MSETINLILRSINIFYQLHSCVDHIATPYSHLLPQHFGLFARSRLHLQRSSHDLTTTTTTALRLIWSNVFRGESYNKCFAQTPSDHSEQGRIFSDKSEYNFSLHLQPFMPLANLRCSPDVHHFLCQAFIPACTEEDKVIRPCREECETVMSDCEENIRIFGIIWPPELQCDK